MSTQVIISGSVSVSEWTNDEGQPQRQVTQRGIWVRDPNSEFGRLAFTLLLKSEAEMLPAGTYDTKDEFWMSDGKNVKFSRKPDHLVPVSPNRKAA